MSTLNVLRASMAPHRRRVKRIQMSYTVELKFPIGVTLPLCSIVVEVPDDMDVQSSLNIVMRSLEEIFSHQPKLQNPHAPSEPENWSLRTLRGQPATVDLLVKERHTELSIQLRDVRNLARRGSHTASSDDQDHKLAAAVRKMAIDRKVVRPGATDLEVQSSIGSELDRLNVLDIEVPRLQGERDRLAHDLEQATSKLRELDRQIYTLRIQLNESTQGI